MPCQVAQARIIAAWDRDSGLHTGSSAYAISYPRPGQQGKSSDGTDQPGTAGEV